MYRLLLESIAIAKGELNVDALAIPSVLPMSPVPANVVTVDPVIFAIVFPNIVYAFPLESMKTGVPVLLPLLCANYY